jgi:hypothetical protein
MVVPPVPPGVEKAHTAAGHRVTGRRQITFEPVALAARQPKVLFFVAAAASPRSQMIDFKLKRRVLLMGVTIAAAVA